MGITSINITQRSHIVLGTASRLWGPCRSPESSSWYQFGFLHFQFFHTEKLEESYKTNSQVCNCQSISSLDTRHSDI